MMNANETEALPCARGCGLFGTRKNNNLCSLCYKKSALEKLATLRFKPESESSAVYPPTSAPIGAEEPIKKQRCGMCRRRVGMTGFSCKCGHTFCGSHRYPEEHSCSFDYKQSGRMALARQLPLIRAEKLHKF